MSAELPYLPEDPREREIFLRALRAYSDNCEPPELTPDCPFAIKTGPGTRGCGNECMDLLARHNAPRSRDETDLGDGWTIRRTRRPRTRRAHNPLAGTYDAREIYLQDKSSGHPSTWRLAAVLVGITELLESPPPSSSAEAEQRRAEIDELRTQIAPKGLSFETHVLPQLRFVTGFALFKEYFTPGGRRSGELEARPSGWALAVREHIESANAEQTVEAFSRGFEGILSTTRNWAATAAWKDLVNWQPPQPSLPTDTPTTPSRVDDDPWIIERFTKTYIKDWSVPALVSEWQYLHGQLAPPCDPAEMRVREVPVDDLARVMADRLSVDPRPREQLTDMLVKPALAFLQDGRNTEAAALFEAALRHDADSADALNNLGFCLLPVDPERSLEYFDAAIDTGRANVELTNANRILALVLLGRRTSAYDLADDHLARSREGNSRGSAWLWAIRAAVSGATPALIECPDIDSYVAELRDIAASSASDNTSAPVGTP